MVRVMRYVGPDCGDMTGEWREERNGRRRKGKQSSNGTKVETMTQSGSQMHQVVVINPKSVHIERSNTIQHGKGSNSNMLEIETRVEERTGSSGSNQIQSPWRRAGIMLCKMSQMQRLNSLVINRIRSGLLDDDVKHVSVAIEG